MCPDWKLNPQPFGVWDDAPTNSANAPRAVFFKNVMIDTVSGQHFRICVRDLIFLFKNSEMGGVFTILQRRKFGFRKVR